MHIFSHTSHSLTIQWQQLQTISSNIRSFYGYEIKYKIEGHVNYGDWQSVSHTGDDSRLSSKITQLEYNSDYEIQIIPFRHMDDVRDHGKAYPRILQKTDCIRELTKEYLICLFRNELRQVRTARTCVQGRNNYGHLCSYIQLYTFNVTRNAKYLKKILSR